MKDPVRRFVWFAVSTASAVVGHQLARQSLNAGWRVAAGEKAPNEGQLQGNLRGAVLWAAATGTLVAVSRVLGRRGAEYGWRRITGRAPPTS